ncbi:heterokaryon incompatibility protein-domain-containing protein [Podospora conica]|nr:heterokaryon incompatibility protein-domain-containing protein [Schizothecium conicum]
MAESNDNSGSATVIGTDDGHDAAPRLCHDCRRIDLRIDKFLIGSRGASIGQDDAADVVEATGKICLASGSAKKVLGAVRTLRERSKICRVCELAWGAIGRYSGADAVDELAQVFFTWEVDGRQRAPGTDRLINRTRRIRLTWTELSGKEENVYLVFVARASAHMLNSDAHAHFLGRGASETKERQALMKSWVDLCVDKHGPDCQNKHGDSSEFNKLLSSTYFGVIDVVDMQLKRLPVTNGVPERYVALSYVWGKRPAGEEPYITKRENVMRHIQHGGLEKEWHKLPRTIQDSILLVSRLGERYIWIDSLCIVQDSNSSWELNAKAMHLVYGNAHFTICAADGDVETGLRAIDPVLRTSEPASLRSSGGRTVSMPASSSLPSASRSRHRSSSPFPPGVGMNGSSPTMSKSARFPLSHAAAELRKQPRAADAANHPPLAAMCLPGIQLLVTRPAEAVIQDSPWNQRGWTFQERLLSRRCLIFADGHVYYQCRSAVISQHIYTDGGGADGWSLDWTNSPLRTLGELRRRAFWFYMKCIRLYTGRELSKPKDILTAFQGVAWLLEDRMKAPLFYGLPSSHFDLALLWMPLQKLERRRQKPSRRHRKEGFGARDFPSWSWCGWMGGKAEYPATMVDGCLQNVQEWLLNHTWIEWHFRDHEGNLRPLWDKNHLTEDGSEEARWKGYKGRTGRLKPRFADPDSGRRRSTMAAGEDHMAGSRPTTGRDDWHRSTNGEYLERVPAGYYEEDDDDEDYTPQAGVATATANTDVDGLADPTQNDDFHNSPRRRREPSRRHDSHPRNLTTFRTSAITSDYRPTYYGDGQYGAPPPYRAPFGAQIPYGSYAGYAPPYGGPPSPPPPQLHFRNAKRIDPQVRHAPDRARPGSPRREEHRRSRRLQNHNCDDASSSSLTASDPSESSSEENRYSDSDSTEQGRRGLGPVPDSYGRPIRPNVAGRDVSKFTGLLPDNPFGVDRGPFDSRQGLRNSMSILQFWTWRTELLVTIREDQSPRETTGRASGSDKLCKCSIFDRAGDWCGAITLARDWITGEEGHPLVFIALSDAKGFTEDECPVWNYYIPKEKEESEWDLYFVMLLGRNRERALWERVAVGKVFQAAFGDAVWDKIKLG